MNSTTTKNLQTYFAPTIVVMPSFSSHEEILLNRVLPENRLMDRTSYTSISKYKVINQNKANISIDTVRELIQDLTYGSFAGELRLIIVYYAELATIPAQNALLKLLEEPPQKTVIYLTTENLSRILETIVSRCTVQQINSNDVEKYDFDTSLYKTIYSKIIQSSHRELMDIAQEYSERPQALSMLNNLVRYLHNSYQQSSPDKLTRISLQYLLQALQQLEQNTNSKLVLEHTFFAIKGASLSK